MNLRVLTIALLFSLTACGQGTTPTKTVAPTASPNAGSVAVLIARPLKLPAMQPGAACPATPNATVSVDVSNPRGHGPFYLGGPLPTGAYPWNKTVYVVTGPPAPGSVLFRGARIDGPGRLQFSGQPATASDPPTRLTSSGGVTAVFYDRVLRGGAADALYVYPSTRGCYAIQVDAATFEDVIVLTAL